MIERDPIEQALADALRPARAPAPGDAELLRRLVDHAVLAPPPVAPLVRAGWLAGGGAGAAAVAAVLVVALHRAPPPPPVRVAAVPVATAAAPEPRVIAPVVELPAPSATVAPPPRVAQPSAAELFARANAARRAGRDAQAVADYHALQRAFPSSPEAVSSHMSLGRLLLDDRSDPAGALAEFDRYLARGAGSALREEALIGRALALGQLGRAEDERRAWKALLSEYPHSMYADQARDRVAALGG